MSDQRWFAVVLSLLLPACGAVASDPPRAASRGEAGAEERVIPNDNRTPAGIWLGGHLTLRLELREARWFPDGADGPGEVVQVFAEEGKAPSNPGPLIRVPFGTRVQVTVTNPLPDSTLVVYGLHARPGSPADTIQVAPGGVREVSFTAGEPGTYFYWGTTTHTSLEERTGIDSQLQGAFVVDPPGIAPPRDRVFVLSNWSGPPPAGAPEGSIDRDVRVVNGLSWPHTEHFRYTVGETVRWRVINPSFMPHPMHLHGFYFAVKSRGTWAADTSYAPGEERHVATETPLPGETFTMEWIPEEPGNWAFHCHTAAHLSHLLGFGEKAIPADMITGDGVDHNAHGMRGMMLGITVLPGKSTARRPARVAGARELRLVAQSVPERYPDGLDGLGYVLQEGDRAPAPDSVPVPSSPIVLRRGEPVNITVVNRMRAPTAVHWHGMELSSYSDGVPGWSGEGKRLAPAIAPGDSFVASFTPSRAGTFIYHSHANELFQIQLGLYGALLVVDPERYDPAHERVFVIGNDGISESTARVNGKVHPDTVRMTAGEKYRLRLIQMNVWGTAEITLRSGERMLQWRALAKDGMELPSARQVVGPSTLLAGGGETADFEFTPAAPGVLTLTVTSRMQFGNWLVQVPIRVERAASIALGGEIPVR
jgi:FtsP/CotA-like multicopper oxidase with cupredoxin domain